MLPRETSEGRRISNERHSEGQSGATDKKISLGPIAGLAPKAPLSGRRRGTCLPRHRISRTLTRIAKLSNVVIVNGRRSSQALPPLFHDQAIIIDLAAVPPIFSAARWLGTVERRQFDATFAKNSSQNLSAGLGNRAALSLLQGLD